MTEVRNSVELGPILNKIALFLLNDQEFCRYVHYMDEDPIGNGLPDINGEELLHKSVLVIPLVNAKEFDTATKICLLIEDGTPADNTEYKEISFSLLIYTPFKSWAINDIQLRPFAIISRVEKLLKGKRIETVGKINYDGFRLDTIDDNLSCYKMRFRLNVFN